MSVCRPRLSILVFALTLLVGCSNNSDPGGDLQIDSQAAGSNPLAAVSNPVADCKPEAGTPHFYRKDILVAGTTGAHDVARDLPGLSRLISGRLRQHLEATDRFNVAKTDNTTFGTMNQRTTRQVLQLGGRHSVQFIVKLELEDLSLKSDRGWFAQLFGRNERNVLVKLYVYDATYGALFHSKQYQKTVSGDVVGDPGTGLGLTVSWFGTDLGETINSMLQTMSEEVEERLACVPFASQVTAIKGDSIFINAGHLHGLRPGEALRTYRRSEVWAPEESLVREERRGWIRLSAVFPNQSIAVATVEELGGARLKVGDIVRAW